MQFGKRNECAHFCAPSTLELCFFQSFTNNANNFIRKSKKQKNKRNYTSTKSWRGYIFTAVCLCVCVCLSVCPIFLWTKFQPNRCTDLDAVFAKWLLKTLARTLLNLVTLGPRSRSRWPKMYVKMMKNDEKKSPKIQI